MINEVVVQGGVWGPVQCSVSIDKIGKDALERENDQNDKQKYAFMYKITVPIPPLGMIDDLAVISKCGSASLISNAIVTSKIEMKKLEYHVQNHFVLD